ncbi:LADA_0F12992g1_1 [Lachancea dasiensis]|uniref:LADA_0F12992g1_1 n=1 Tax=Lachancea dasiensis TaxID=1072105 RepID=A0A1G4JN14_9SACH|nr:LADA_0F12992g1_1 [Lachancea dasiensis]
MDSYRGGKRSSISFGSYQRPMVNYNQSDLSSYGPRHVYSVERPPAQQAAVAFYPCRYEAAFPLFALDWSSEDYVAVGSYKEDTFNKLQILHSSDVMTWEKIGEENCALPVSRVQWCPTGGSQQLATCSDSLRLWRFADFSLQEQLNLSLHRYNKTSGASGSVSSLGQLPPVSSFHWNAIDPNLIISSSIDTTCTVWDLQANNYVKTQLIAHDSEVYDVKFLTQSTQLFASCGGDGSVRVFDLRSLAHSTIIYEPSTNTGAHDGSGSARNSSGSKAGPGSAASGSASGSATSSNAGSHALLRLEPSPFDPNVVATFAHDSTSVLVLDMRYPGAPVLTLEAHSGAVNQIQWHPSRRNVLASCSDDCQVLIWDLNTQLTTSAAATNASSKWNNGKAALCVDSPQQAYNESRYEVNNIVWQPQGDWLGCNMGRQFQSVRV